MAEPKTPSFIQRHMPQWLSMVSRRSLVTLSDMGKQTSCRPLPFEAVEVPSFDYKGEKKLIAEGCQGRVYRADTYAIKECKGDVKCFRREINLLARLKHPNICQLKAVGEGPCALLEWVEPLTGGMEIVVELAGVLNWLQTEAISGCVVVHRDLKPDNYGVKNGHLKLLDFGLAVCLQGTLHDKYRLTGNTGSIRYMAPEVGRDEEYGAKVDVYSFAITAWELLKREKPYACLDVKMHSQYVLHGDYRPHLPKKWQSELSSILRLAWHSDPSKRPTFATILQVLQDLGPDPLGADCCFNIP